MGVEAWSSAAAPRDPIEASERGLAWCATVLLVLFHLLVLLLSGPLWRDETATVNLSGFPWGAVWASLQHENFPLAWLGILRGFALAGLGRSDLSLRVAGFLVGIGVVAAIWRTARTLGVRWPIVSLLLLGWSPVVLRVGDSLRAYGLGILLVLITLGAVWRLVQNPSAPRVLLLAAAALFSVHTVIYSLVTLCAILAGGIALALRRGQFATVAALAGTGVIALASLSIYVPSLVAAQSWVDVVRSDVHLTLIVRRLLRTWIEGGYAVAIAWAVALPWTLARSARAIKSDLGLFVFVATVTALTGYFAFLRVLDYSPQPWYYLPLLALLAMLIDATLDTVVRDRLPWRRRRRVAIVAILILSMVATARAALTRQSNIDLCASAIRSRASADDLVLVHPWWCGISFARYYRGSAPWSTVPEIEDHSLHRYDLLRQRLLSPDPIGPLLGKIESTLETGHRVWLATTFDRTSWEHARSPDEDAPGKARSSSEDARAARRFSHEIGALLDRLAPRIRQVPITTPLPVNKNETLLLFEIGIPGQQP